MTEQAAFPLIHVEGDAATRGRSYGRQAGDRILRSIAIYQRALAADGVDWAVARSMAQTFLPTIDAIYPEAVIEMRGIAEGAEVDPLDIVAINARTELLYGRPDEPTPASAADGCTAALAMPAATRGGRLLHGQNWDWRDECCDTAVVLRIVPEHGPRILTFVEAGLLARCGMNSAGIALTGNFIRCEHDFARRGTPAPLIRRAILGAERLAEACGVVFNASLSFSNNMMISHAGGEAFDLEATPGETFWIAPEGDLLVHANHFVSPAAQAKLRDISLLENPDSLYRDRRVHAYLAARHGEITPETLIEAFQDRYGAPEAVCRSPVHGPGGDTSSTVATIIMDAGAGRMWAAPRPYGPHRFTEYVLD